jgi:hypothetical protein
MTVGDGGRSSCANASRSTALQGPIHRRRHRHSRRCKGEDVVGRPVTGGYSSSPRRTIRSSTMSDSCRTSGGEATFRRAARLRGFLVSCGGLAFPGFGLDSLGGRSASQEDRSGTRWPHGVRSARGRHRALRERWSRGGWRRSRGRTSAPGSISLCRSSRSSRSSTTAGRNTRLLCSVPRTTGSRASCESALAHRSPLFRRPRCNSHRGSGWLLRRAHRGGLRRLPQRPHARGARSASVASSAATAASSPFTASSSRSA